MQPISPTRRSRSAVASFATASLVASGLAMAPSAIAAEGTTDIQILAVNDFHGRIVADHGNGLPGAAYVAGALDALRDDNPNTIFASAGDNIGASIFESFSLRDEPTIDSLVEMGLDVAAVGNHEFDQGLGDLVTRVLPRYSATDGGKFGLGANVYYAGTTIPRLQEFHVQEVDGVRVGFIGTVTTDTPNMVTPTGVAGLSFGDELEAVERVASRLTDDDEANGEADVIVLLTHSGFETGDCAALATDTAGFGVFARAVPPSVDAIFTGHTHQDYACDVPVDGAPGVERPVVQGLEYGKKLGQVVLTVDTDTMEVVASVGDTIALLDDDDLPVYPTPNAAVADIVADAVAESDVVGSQEIGAISGDILRGGTPPGQDRGVESTLGNLIADVQLWATSNDSFAGEPAQVGIMNPGGLRADLLYTGDGTVTFKQVANVQPFANTLVAMDLTGAQLKEVLELQWKESGDRPKLHLGISEGFEYYYTETSERSGTVHQMRYLGEVVEDDDVLRVVVNSFLATGGDGFAPFADGTNRADTGQVDLEATVNFFDSHDVVDPAPLGRAVAGDPPPLPEEPEEKIATSVTAVVVPKKIEAGEKTNVVAIVEGATSGEVEFRANGKVVATAEVNSRGRASTSFKRKVGTYAITAHYLENETHLGSASAAETLKVVRAASKITSVKAKKSIKRSKTLTITVKVAPKGLAAKGTVVVRYKGKKVGTAKVNAKGIAKVKVKAKKLGKKGIKKLEVRYEKSSQLKASKKVHLKVRVR